MSASRQRRPRLTDADTGRRMIAAALGLLAEQGVTVGLDGLLMEDVIRHAEVSRTSAYRHWPTREAFLADVLLELSRGTELTEVGGRISDEGVGLLARYVGELTTSVGRYEFFIALLRLSFQADLEATLASPQFRTYLSLRAAFLGVPTAGLRAALTEELARSERRAVARAATILAGAVQLLGLRLRAPLVAPEGFDVLARTISAASTGFVVAALAEPELMHPTQHLAPYGSSIAADWSIPALGLAGVVIAHIETDPDAPPPSIPELLESLTALVDQGAAAPAR